MGRVVERRMTFEFPSDLRPAWNPALPEFSSLTNAVSLMMPYVEPFIVRAMRHEVPSLDGPLAEETRAYIAQEAAHHAQHRRFNELIARQVRGVPTLERMLGATYRWLWRSRSERFRLAYAAALEGIAYGIARWTERHHHELFAGADPTVASLYLWHLAEEVEHKSVAYDVYDARHGSRLPLVGAMATAVAVLTVFTVIGTTLGLMHERRLWHPVAIGRLLVWGVSFIFTELPNIALSVLPGHHPRDFTDPTWFSLYLATIS